MQKNIIIEEVLEELPELELKKGDYAVAYPMNFYAGAGVYGINGSGGIVKLSRCIENLDGKILIKEVGNQNQRSVTPADFKKIVNHKLFARIIIDNNLPSIAVEGLRVILRGE